MKNPPKYGGFFILYNSPVLTKCKEYDIIIWKCGIHFQNEYYCEVIMKKTWQKVLLIIGISLLGLLLIVGGFALAGNLYVANQSADDTPAQVEITPNELGTVVAVGRGLYDASGNRFDIKGINFGNLFIAEGWMTVNSIGALYNEDGSFQSVNEQGVVEAYEEIYQQEFDAILADRVAKGDFTEEQLVELLEDAQ